jgi:DNA-binding MarR family transcriptional regulator
MTTVICRDRLISMAGTPTPVRDPDKRPDPDAAPGEPLAGIGATLSRLYRLWDRRQMQALPPVDATMSRKDLNRAMAVELVQDGMEKGHEITIGAMAGKLDVDPSAASRIVSDAIQAGHLRRVPSQRDARRALLEPTPAGRDLLTRFRKHQRAVFERITRDWDPHKRDELARLLADYVNAMEQLRAEALSSRASDHRN